MSNIQQALSTLFRELGFVPASDQSPARPTTGYQSPRTAAPTSVRDRVASAPNTFSLTANDGTVVTVTELPGRAGARFSIPGVGNLEFGAGAVLGLRDALVQATRV